MFVYDFFTVFLFVFSNVTPMLFCQMCTPVNHSEVWFIGYNLMENEKQIKQYELFCKTPLMLYATQSLSPLKNRGNIYSALTFHFTVKHAMWCYISHNELLILYLSIIYESSSMLICVSSLYLKLQ